MKVERFDAATDSASVRRVLALDRVPAGRAGLRAGAEARVRLDERRGTTT